MEPLFIDQDFFGREILGYRPWLNSGLLHGFCGKSFNFSEPFLAESSALLCNEFKTQRLVLLEQLHGREIVDFREGKSLSQDSGAVVVGKGDGLLIPLDRRWKRQIAFGIRTADCLPVVFRSDELLALVHAGWRGLAAGILQNTVKAFSGSTFEAVIFPAAGQARYEVGLEVITALEPLVRFKPIKSGKALLGLEDTAELIIETVAPRSHIVKSSLCTISDPRFHSFRRDGRGGSNLCFVIPD